ncbi:hypothetical protein Gogos_022289 [Gossypium gossypioides]|uniref:Uncharacterized protein n=1 Tax=Gossypium gossypioides TaxID=34282 RepID=A0A7J9D594_GOSGO|nr:hypothetical protein [Gossypium gossypioides]
MDVSTTQSQLLKPNQDGSTFSITDAAMLLVENIRAIGLELSRSIASEKVLQESAQKSYPALCEVEGLTEDKRYHALRKILDHQM